MTRIGFCISLALSSLFLGACLQGGSLPVAPEVKPADYVAGLPTGADQQRVLCARNNQDVFSLWYCGTNPVITSLEDVLEGVGLKDPANVNSLNFALTGHSTS